MRMTTALATALILSLGLLLDQASARRDLPAVYQPPPASTNYYRDPYLCPILKVSTGSRSSALQFWTCGTPSSVNYCGQRGTVEYVCCPGYMKSDILGGKCGEAESAWRLIPDFLSTYGRTKMSGLLTSASELSTMSQELSKAVYTVFATYTETSFSSSEVDLTSYSGGGVSPVTASVAVGRTYSLQLTNGATLTSKYNSQKLKVTTYSNNLVFVECRALVYPDHEARNGVIHYLNGPIMPHNGAGIKRSTLLQALQNNPDTSGFARDLPSDVKQMLGQADSKTWYTVYAPTNAAWSTAKRTYSGRQNIAKLVRNHIVSRMICAQAISERSTRVGPTLQNEYIGVDCAGVTSQSVLDRCGRAAVIKSADLMAGNGVLHVISGVLAPLAVMQAADAVACLGKASSVTTSGGTITDWVKTRSVVTTSDYWQGCSISLSASNRYVLLLPTDDAFTWLRNYNPLNAQAQRFRNDRTYRCNTLKYHVLQLTGQLKNLQASWWNQVVFSTELRLNGRQHKEANYYVKTRDGSFLYFEYSYAVDFQPLEFANGYIYFIRRINIIPEPSRYEIMQGRTDFSIITQKVQSAGYNNRLEQVGPLSLFLLPRNRGFGGMTTVNSYTGTSLMEFLQLHTIKLRGWGDDIGYFERETYQEVETLLNKADGTPFRLRIWRQLNGNTYIGYDGLPKDKWAMVLEWNLFGWDGIIWVIDWPLACPEGLCGGVRMEYDLFKVAAAACTTETGVATGAEFNNDPIGISKRNSDKCTIYRMPPKQARKVEYYNNNN